MLFNPDPKKPAQEVIFSRKKQSQNHPTISRNNIHVEGATYQKHLGIILDEKLKRYKGISVIKKLCHSLPRKSLITIYKAFLKSLIDYGDITMTSPKMNLFVKRLNLYNIKLL